VLSFLAASNATVVVATHDADVIEWCDVIVELRDGELVIR
jgi:ABC-type lipoprotein export system ATPase subunit